MTVTDRGQPFTPREVLLTDEQVSAWTGISRGALRQLRYLGEGPRYRRLTPKTIRYLESDVSAWIEAARTGTRAG